ncbi:unnamed protein product, partial [Oppiella nova]
SLTINDVTPDDEGAYLCQANNGVGSGLSKLVQLKVHVGAHFAHKFGSQTVTKGQDVWIECLSLGENPIAIVVTRDGIPFDPNIDNRYEVIRNETNDAFGLRLHIRDTNRRDSALYTCSAHNRYGSDEYNHQIIVQEPPDIPENVRISEISSRSALISWMESFTGNTILTKYRLELKTSANSWQSSDTSVETIAGNENSFTIRGLKPITSYHIRVRAQNKLGFSAYCPDIHFTTQEEEPSGPPLHIQVFPLSARSLAVTFRAPAPETRNGRIQGYYLGYKALEMDTNFMFKKLAINELSNDGNQQNEVNITSLMANTKYAIVVQAFNG